MSPLFRLLLAVGCLLALGLTPTTRAQSDDEAMTEKPLVTLDAGVTLTSRFLYRGLNLGEAPQVQPMIALNIGAFQVATWSSHPIAPKADESTADPGDNYREVLFWMRYDVPMPIGTVTPYVQNHYNPNTGQLFNFDNGGGAHYLQGQLMFAGNDKLPVDAMVGYVFYNDPNDSIYLEAGYRFQVGENALRAFVGGVPDRSPFNGYDEDGPQITNVGLSAARSLQITDRFALPLRFSFVFNPYTEDALAAFSISL